MDGSRRLFRSAIQSTHDRMKTEGSKLAGLVVTAIGIVFGDIGTSPLYAVRETFAGHHPLPVTSQNLFGILSLVVWTIVIVVSVKYVSLIMRADNRGEGGSLALLALVSEVTERYPRRAAFSPSRHLRRGPVLRRQHDHAGNLGLSAVEGLEVVTPQLEKLCHPADRGHPHRPLRAPEPWHRRGRADVRPDHGGLVLDAGAARLRQI